MQPPSGGSPVVSVCQTCDAPILWAIAGLSRRKIALDPVPTDDGTVVIERREGRHRIARVLRAGEETHLPRYRPHRLAHEQDSTGISERLTGSPAGDRAPAHQGASTPGIPSAGEGARRSVVEELDR